MALLGYYDVTMLRWHCYREPLFDREEHMVTRIIVQPSTASYATPELDVKCFIFSVGSTLMGCCQAIACDYNQLLTLNAS